MEMRFETISPCKTAYIRRVGLYGIGNAKTMERLKIWAKLNGLLNESSIILGIAQDDPETTRPDDCRYDACILVSDNYRIDEKDVRAGNIEGGYYAVFTISHTAQAVQKAWNDIFPELLKQGCQIDKSKPILERYKAETVKNHLCEICVPVKRP